MAKFCKYCGKQLEDGEACTCNGAGNTVKNQAKGVWHSFGEFVKNPVSAGTEFVQQRNIRNALIFIGIYACLFALFVVSILSKYNGFWKTLAINTGSYDSEAMATLSTISFPLTSVFFIIAITVFTEKCIFPLSLMLGTKIFKGETDYAYMLCASGIKSLTLSPFLALAVIVSFLMPLNSAYITGIALEELYGIKYLIAPVVVPVCISVLGTALSNYITLCVIPGGSSVSKDKIPYIMFIAGIIMLIVTVIAFKIVFPLTLPVAFKQMYSALKNGGIEAFLDVLEDIF